MAPREVRQPEVARLTRLLLALVLVLPVLRGAERLGVAAAFLIEFADDRRPTLSALTAAPVEQPRDLPEVAADRFTPRTLRTPTPLVLEKYSVSTIMITARGRLVRIPAKICGRAVGTTMLRIRSRRPTP